MRRILVIIVGQGSVIHIIRSGLLQNMRDFCTPVVGILWDDEALRKELTEKGIENHVLPPFTISGEYATLRQQINIWYLAKVLRSPSTAIMSRYMDQYTHPRKRLKKKIKERLIALKHRLPSYTKALLADEKAQLKKEAVFESYKHWIEALQIDGLYTVTPFLYEVEVLARICRQKQLPIIASIHSFDNVTKRDWPGIFFDHYIVWNKYNKAELIRINAALENKITIAGVPQFDFHFNPSCHMSKEEWLNKLALPGNKKIILYGGGAASLFPNEPQYLQHLKEALEKEEITKNAIILFRSHPLDKLERWEKKVGKFPFIFYAQAPNGSIKLDYTNVSHDDIQMLIATLQYSDVHINLCSTMAIDGSVFKKPQIGPAYDEATPHTQHLLKKLYLQEHYIPIIKSGNIHLAESRQQLIHLVNTALENPDSMTGNAEQCVREIITFIDGKSAKRVSDKLSELFS